MRRCYEKANKQRSAILNRVFLPSGRNACDKMSPHVPWSGRKGSGMGCTLGLEGLNAFLQPKALHLMRPAGVRHNSTSAP